MLTAVAGMILKIVGVFNLVCATVSNIGMVFNMAGGY
jgi:hypothetical protein